MQVDIQATRTVPVEEKPLPNLYFFHFEGRKKSSNTEAQ
jgi:hypothetical protein